MNKEIKTIFDVVENFDQEHKIGVTFLGGNGELNKSASYSALLDAALKRLDYLIEIGHLPGERSIFVIPDAEQFTVTFLACILGGIVPVPVAPPQQMRGLAYYEENLKRVADISGSKNILTSERLYPLLKDSKSLSELSVHQLFSSTTCRPHNLLHRPKPEELAFIQFTSGSTANPKGVMVTHQNLAANISAVCAHLKWSSEHTACSWLPQFHDMGLIGMTLSPMWARSPLVLMEPLTFLKCPALWLKMMSEHEGYGSFAPNFAYAYATRRIKDSELEGVSLSNWKIAGCGAEPVRAHVLAEFATRFAAWGFQSSAFIPCYGLAESTLAVTMSSLDSGVKVDRISRDTLTAENRAQKSNEEQHLDITSCGIPFPEHEIRIVGEAGETLADRRVGEVVVRGPSVTKGYFKNKEATESLLRNGWMHTGDLGYLADGELFVCGRKKEMIIIAGRNYYPVDIEWHASSVQDIRRGNVAAFSVPGNDEGQESVVVYAETRAPLAKHKAIENRVQSQVREALGLVVRDVVLLAPGSLPKTSSGKIQRVKCRQHFMAGLPELGSSKLHEPKFRRSILLGLGYLLHQVRFLRNRVAFG